MGHELIKKKLIIAGLILSALCVIGLALIFIPNWNGKKENNTTSGVRVYNPVQNATGVSNGKNPTIDNSIQNTTNGQIPVTINPIQNTTIFSNGQIPVTITLKQNISGISYGRNPITVDTIQYTIGFSNGQTPITVDTIQYTKGFSNGRIPVTTTIKQNDSRISNGQNPVTITITQNVPGVSNGQNPVIVKQNVPDMSNVQYSVDDNNFDYIFLKMESNKKNMIYSPISIEYALNMLKDGAIGSTFDEINRVISNRKISKYPNIDKVLSLGNGLFIRSLYYEYIKKDYSNILKEKYNAEIVPDEFKNIQSVNQWIENRTLGTIKNMLSDDIVKDPKLLMIIVNAIAIDMEWDNQFSFGNTDRYPFFLENGGRKEVQMMHLYEVKRKGVTYYEGDNKTVLTMDLKEYNGIQLEFMAIMPHENLSTYVESVSKEQISKIDNNLKSSSNAPYGVNVRIPKFKFSYYLNLKQDLNKLGIKNAFSSDNANFSKMAIVKEMDRNLFVSDALHKTDIKFTEDGLKDAAAPVIGEFTTCGTTITTETKASISETETATISINMPIDITINQPFMFIIRDKNTKDIWFTGTVYEPDL